MNKKNIHPTSEKVNRLRSELAKAIRERNESLRQEYDQLKRGETVQSLADRYDMKRTTVIEAVRSTYQPE